MSDYEKNPFWHQFIDDFVTNILFFTVLPIKIPSLSTSTCSDKLPFHSDFRTRIDCWTSAGKELALWLFACAVLLAAELTVFVPFSYDVWGRKWNSSYGFLIIALPFHRLPSLLTQDPDYRLPHGFPVYL